MLTLLQRQLQGLPHPADSSNRYGKYIPGYKWKTGAAWAADPAVAVQDLNVNPLVYPGDVFVIGDIRATGNSGYPWWASQQCDIDFGHTPWGGETVGAWYCFKTVERRKLVSFQN